MAGPGLDEVIRRALDDRLLDVHTSTLARVEGVDSDGTLRVRLLSSRPVPSVDGGYVYEDPPVIPGAIPLAFGTARSFIQTSLQSGDLVWLLFSEASLDEALQNQSVSNPAVVTRHSYTTPLAIPVCLPAAATGSNLLALANKVDQAFSDLVSWLTSHTHPTPSGASSAATPAPSTPASTAAAEVKAK